MRYEFLQHMTSGDIYAVASYDGKTDEVALVSEPLSRREVEQHNNPSDYEMTDDDAEWMTRNLANFSLYEPQ